jgi:hypothetical protein
MDVTKLILGKKVYTNLSGEQAAMKIYLHNAMKNMPPYLNMQNFDKEIEHMMPRTSSFTELPSDFFQKNTQVKVPIEIGKTQSPIIISSNDPAKLDPIIAKRLKKD